MLKEKFTTALKTAIKKRDKDTVNTIRLILAVVKDKEISLKTNGDSSEMTNDDIFTLLKSMIKQRRESIDLYKTGKREDLAKKEENEIKTIELFLPKQLNEEETRNACKNAILKLSVSNVSDIGKVMNELKSEFASQIDMGRAASYVNELLVNKEN